MALAAYEESLCSGCGQDTSVTYNPDAEGWFEAHELVCAGCAAKQQHGGNDPKSKQTPGAKVYVVDARPAGLELAAWSPSGLDDKPADEEPDAE